MNPSRPIQPHRPRRPRRTRHPRSLELGAALLLSAAALLAPACAQAAEPFTVTDTPPSADTTPAASLLGKRYIEASATLTDYNHAEDNSFALGTAVNLPLTAHLDLGASYAHSWFESDTSADRFDDLAVSLTAYTRFCRFTPYARATLGYEWWTISNDPFYQLEAGGEYLLTTRLSVSAQVGWSEFLAADWNGGSFSGSARANYWITAALAAAPTLGYSEGGNLTYGLSLVYQF